MNLILGERSTLHIKHQRITHEIVHLEHFWSCTIECALGRAILEMNDFWVGRIYGNGRISMHGKILDQVQVKSGRKKYYNYVIK